MYQPSIIHSITKPMHISSHRSNLKTTNYKSGTSVNQLQIGYPGESNVQIRFNPVPCLTFNLPNEINLTTLLIVSKHLFSCIYKIPRVCLYSRSYSIRMSIINSISYQHIHTGNTLHSLSTQKNPLTSCTMSITLPFVNIARMFPMVPTSMLFRVSSV